MAPSKKIIAELAVAYFHQKYAKKFNHPSFSLYFESYKRQHTIAKEYFKLERLKTTSKFPLSFLRQYRDTLKHLRAAKSHQFYRDYYSFVLEFLQKDYAQNSH